MNVIAQKYLKRATFYFFIFVLIKLLFKAVSLKVETAVSRGLDIQHGFGTVGEELV